MYGEVDPRLHFDGSFIPLSTDCFTVERVLDKRTKIIKMKSTDESTRLLEMTSHPDPAIICIFDELKELFKVDKVGYHYTIYRGTKYLLKRHATSCFPIKSYHVKMKEMLTYQTLDTMRRIVMLKEVIGLSKNSLKKIGIIDKCHPIKVISFKEHKSLQVSVNQCVTDSITFNHLFTERSMKEVASEIFNINDVNALQSSLSMFRDRVTEIQHRVSSQHDWVVSYLCCRLQRLLMSL